MGVELPGVTFSLSYDSTRQSPRMRLYLLRTLYAGESQECATVLPFACSLSPLIWRAMLLLDMLRRVVGGVAVDAGDDLTSTRNSRRDESARFAGVSGAMGATLKEGVVVLQKA